MSVQSEALRLADALIAATGQTDAEDDVIHVARWFVEDAAAELRRLHAENRALTDALFQAQEAAKALLAQRDALLEALCELLADAEFLGWDTTKARAAIKAVEEGK